MLITDLLRQNAQQYPGESALVSVDTKNLIPDQPDSYEACRRTLTWKQFDALANRIANYLLHMGIRKGSKVGIMMMNRIEYLPLFLEFCGRALYLHRSTSVTVHRSLCRRLY